MITNMKKRTILSLVKMTIVSVQALLNSLYDAIDRELKEE